MGQQARALSNKPRKVIKHFYPTVRKPPILRGKSEGLIRYGTLLIYDSGLGETRITQMGTNLIYYFIRYDEVIEH